MIAPSSIEECFYDTVEAFNLAEKYQVPVIVATDLQLSLGKQSCEMLDYSKVSIDRGYLVKDIPDRDDSSMFNRYAFTENGISPRVLPGEKNGIHHVTGVEHDESGRPSESTVNRKKMMDKRLRKLAQLEVTNPVHLQAPHAEPDLLIIGMGSTGGTIDQARVHLSEDGVKTNHMTVRLMHPFPTEQVLPQIAKAKKVVVLENNATGQLANLIKQNVGYHDKIVNVLKYNGNPFLPSEVYEECKKAAGNKAQEELVKNGKRLKSSVTTLNLTGVRAAAISPFKPLSNAPRRMSVLNRSSSPSFPVSDAPAGSPVISTPTACTGFTVARCRSPKA
ncbi:hypothetical protein HMSSN139_33600 [Paenibacillus sp. HMSSN-139]|nr:hypothetical protein HMSSN139_33600 [Paenibacillus sp. HMSSN-139]